MASHQTAKGTNLRTGGVEDLRGLVIDRATRVAAQTRHLADVQSEVDAISATRVNAQLTAQIAALENVAGVKPLTGPALVVSLDDAPYTTGTTLPEGVVPDDLVVHQQDVQAVVNAMWRGNATGVMVMDQRIASTTAIRCVGNTLLMQGRVYSPPFTVTAVGDEVHRRARDEFHAASAGVDVDDDVAEREEHGGEVVRDLARDRTLGRAGEGAVHVHAVHGREARGGARGGKIQRGDEDEASADLLGREFAREFHNRKRRNVN